MPTVKTNMQGKVCIVTGANSRIGRATALGLAHMGAVQNATLGSTIVLENLTNIRDHVTHRKGEGQRRMHSWSFAQFHSFVSYKAQAKGIVVVKIDPRHTSQQCSRCGYQARNNRRSQSLFLCRTCGYCLNADLNASYNIRDK